MIKLSFTVSENETVEKKLLIVVIYAIGANQMVMVYDETNTKIKELSFEGELDGLALFILDNLKDLGDVNFVKLIEKDEDTTRLLEMIRHGLS